MDSGDTASLPVTLGEAERRLAAVGAAPGEVVADKGYHSNKTMTGVRDRGLRSHVSEPDWGRRNWRRNPDAKKPTHANRRRIRGDRGKRLLCQRGEKLERGFAHMLETGGLRRVHVRRRGEIRERILMQAAAFNLELLMCSLYGIGTLGSPSGPCSASFATVSALWARFSDLQPPGRAVAALPARRVDQPFVPRASISSHGTSDVGIVACRPCRARVQWMEGVTPSAHGPVAPSADVTGGSPGPSGDSVGLNWFCGEASASTRCDPRRALAGRHVMMQAWSVSRGTGPSSPCRCRRRVRLQGARGSQ